MESNGFISIIWKKIKKLIKEKLFLVSLACYLLIPIAAVFVAKVKVPKRTTGIYECYENGVLSGRITLGNKYYVKVESFSDVSKKDIEFQRGTSDGISWQYRVSDWYKEEKYTDPGFKYLSQEYVRFKYGNESFFYAIFFVVDGNLYTDYLVDETRGGGQKCYQKV